MCTESADYSSQIKMLLTALIPHSAFFCPDRHHRPFDSWLIFIFLKSGNFNTKSAFWHALELPWWITLTLTWSWLKFTAVLQKTISLQIFIWIVLSHQALLEHETKSISKRKFWTTVDTRSHVPLFPDDWEKHSWKFKYAQKCP